MDKYILKIYYYRDQGELMKFLALLGVMHVVFHNAYETPDDILLTVSSFVTKAIELAEIIEKRVEEAGIGVKVVVYPRIKEM